MQEELSFTKHCSFEKHQVSRLASLAEELNCTLLPTLGGGGGGGVLVIDVAYGKWGEILEDAR
jgi:hypothetical protein